MLEIDQVSKRFGSRLALDAVSLKIEAGEIVCLLGANGAGKSTTLKLLLGFLQPDAGRIRIAGLDTPEGLRDGRRSLAYIPEVVQLYSWLNAVETLHYFSDMLGAERLGAADASELLARVGLPGAALQQRVSTYSKGMRQKLALALTLIKKSRALLLDEPLSGLDPQAANDFVADIRSMANTGMAVLLVTHDVMRAATVADRVGIMRNGRLLAVLRGRDLSGPELERIYIQYLRDVSVA